MPPISYLSPAADLIRKRFEPLRALDPEAHQALLAKIEFSFIARQKIRAKQLVRNHVLRRSDAQSSPLSQRRFVECVNKSDGKRSVLFVARHPTFDFMNASEYLRKSGRYRTALLLQHATLSPLMQQHFDAIWVYPTLYDLCAVLLRLRPSVIHAQGSSSFYPFPAIARLLSDAPVATQAMDFPSVYKPTEADYADRGGRSEYTLDCRMQSYSFQETDGVTIFNYPSSVSDRFRGPQGTGIPTIEFHNYPLAHDTIRPKSRATRGDDIHIVYAGIIEPSHVSRAHFGDLQMFEVIKKITTQRLHLHVYPSPHFDKAWLRRRLFEYVDIASRNPYFHYHDPVGPDQIAQELSQYHYGSLIYTLKNIREFDWVRVYREAGGPGSKFFTYLKAGLPVIVLADAHGSANLVRKYGNGIVVEEDELHMLSQILASRDPTILDAGVVRAQKELSMDAQFPRLLGFYEQVIEHRNSLSQHAHGDRPNNRGY